MKDKTPSRATTNSSEQQHQQEKKKIKIARDRVSTLELHQVKLMDELWYKKYELIVHHRRYMGKFILYCRDLW